MQKPYYVTPHSLQWMIFSPGVRGVELERSRARAIERAKELAREHGDGTIVVARRDGTTETTPVGGGPPLVLD